MAKFSLLAGATSQSVNLFVQSTASSVAGTGAGLAGLTSATASLIAYYTFTGTACAATQITLAALAAVSSAYNSGGIKEISSANMTGLYRFDLPNAMVSSGSGQTVTGYLSGAANMAPCVFEIELTGWNNQDAVHGGMSALPNTACTSNASLITSGTGTAQLSVTSGIAQANVEQWDSAAIAEPTTDGVPDVNVLNWNGTVVATPATAGIPDVNVKNIGNQTASASGTITFPAATLASTINITSGTITTCTNLTNAATAGDLTSTMKTSVATAVWQDATAGDFTVSSSIGKSLYTSGNAPGAASGIALVGSNVGTATSVTGAVGSVTGNVGGNVVGTVSSVVGAVGSVTGNVGGNVVGSVASVTASVAITSNRKKAATATFEFLMQDSTTGAPKTGLSPASTISKDGAAPGATANSVTEIGLGQYQIVLTSSEMNCNNGFFQATAASANTTNLSIQTQP